MSAETKENCIIVTQRTKPDTLASKLLSNAINNTIDITIGKNELSSYQLWILVILMLHAVLVTSLVDGGEEDYQYSVLIIRSSDRFYRSTAFSYVIVSTYLHTSHRQEKGCL